MATKHVVVDGSNIATEGRSHPSLKQLREAIAAFETDHKGAKITVVVDATFEYRVNPKERRAAQLAVERGEIVAPPAGAIGRGDAFLLQIAQKTDAMVLSNDSFQEFHDEHKWLFEPGRLIGGKPVPNVGWVFTERSPVRARNGARSAGSAASEERVMDRAIAAATREIVSEGGSKKSKENEPVNEPLVFIQFIADHRIGTEVRGTVDRFTAHGAFVMVGSARCYIPLTGMGSPAPRSPRSVLSKGERRNFVVKTVNPGRRDIELALPGVGKKLEEVPVETTPVAAETVASTRAKRKPTRKRARPVAAKSRRKPARKTSKKRTATKKVARKKTVKKRVSKKRTTRRAPVSAKKTSRSVRKNRKKTTKRRSRR
jgi:hypothetical protein